MATSTSKKRQGCFCLKNKAFTLVELLVVIAIISILAGMLLPALENAIGGAKTLTCMNNQKQLGSAFMMYADDFEGWSVATLSGGNYSSPKPRRLGFWTFHLSPYVNTEWDVADTFPSSGTQVFYCPSANPTSIYDFGGQPANLLSYGYSYYFYDSTSFYYANKKISQLEAPSETLCTADLWDARDENICSSIATLSNNINNHRLDKVERFAWRHSQQLNVLFFDSHVAIRGQDENGVPDDIIFY